MIINGEPIYFGKHGSPESWDEDLRLIAEKVLDGSGASTSQAGTEKPRPRGESPALGSHGKMS